MASSRMSYYSAMSVEDDDLEFGVPEGADPDDGRTPLDKTIDRIGMGWYQWTLLSLCGFGWMADNMWIQAIAIVLPRVQQHFAVRDSYIGTLSSSMFAGMMFGAVGWGTCSDLMGRTTAFNATLFLTSLFGLVASFANTFIGLCLALFLLGSAVGGSMPTDGALLLEHMPNGKQYLVTALSVFFSFGAVLSAVVGLLVIPSHSCPPAPAECDVNAQNWGWKYLLMALGLITLSMFLARMVFFRLHESPRYLVHAGRPQEALESLQLISRFNGSELLLDLDDVQDHLNATTLGSESSPDVASIRAPISANQTASFHFNDPAAVLFDADGPNISPSTLDGNMPSPQYPEHHSLSSQQSNDVLHTPSDPDSKNYSSIGESNVPLDGHVFVTPHIPQDPHRVSVHSIASNASDAQMHDMKDASPSASPFSARSPSAHRPPPESPILSQPRSSVHERGASRRQSTASAYELRSKVYWKLPRWLRRPLWAWLDRVAMVLSPEWRRTTLLMWGAWWGMSLAYTMFNVYLPKLLEARGSLDPDAAPKTLEESLWDVVIYALGGCPGAILGAYLIESPLGRRWSLAGSTFVTAFFCWIFVLVEQPWAVRASTVGISLSATAMWAVLYGWTPEIFGTKVRGTACGIASALSRIGGMIAPMLGGSLLSINSSVPVYTSIVVFLLAGVCVLLLEEKEVARSAKRVLAH